MKQRLVATFALLTLLALLPSAGRARAEGEAGQTLPAYSVSEPASAVVTKENLLGAERFWPYRVTLTRAWQPAGVAKPLPVGSVGVLIRVEPSGLARADFGRDGLYDVPIDVTDLLANANRIRTGEEAKDGPNFAISILPRLAESGDVLLRPVDVGAAMGARTYLAVFVDPAADEFPDLAKQLAPLRERDGLRTILFPQGAYNDEKMREQLRSIGWPIAFAFDHLSDYYTKSMLDETTRLPAVVLYSPEGRVLFEKSWTSKTQAELVAEIDTVLGKPLPPTQASSTAPAPVETAVEAVAPATPDPARAPEPAAASTGTP